MVTIHKPERFSTNFKFCDLTVKDTENNQTKYRAHYPQSDVNCSVQLTVKTQTGFGKFLLTKTVPLPFFKVLKMNYEITVYINRLT